MKIILIGIQGAGKSTQGNMLHDKYEIPYLSSGHIFREMTTEKSALGRYMKEVVNSGALVPDSKVVPIIEEYLAKEEYNRGYILDGFPRTVPQAEQFSNGVDLVIYLDVSDKEALWRLSGRVDEGVREDNTLHAIRRRIELFHEKTLPVLDYYEKSGRLFTVNGEREIDDIFTDICQIIDKHG